MQTGTHEGKRLDSVRRPLRVSGEEWVLWAVVRRPDEYCQYGHLGPGGGARAQAGGVAAFDVALAFSLCWGMLSPPPLR